MRPTNLFVSLGGMCVLLLFSNGPAVHAVELRFADTVTITSDEVIDGTLIASGGRVTMAGTVNGDVLVWGGFVKVSGRVNGSLHAAGGYVSISGEVTGNLWAAGGNLNIPGQVMGDLIVAGGIVDLDENAEAKRDLFLCAGMTAVSGTVGGDVGGGVGSLSILGSVIGSVDVDTDHLTLHPTAAIGGDLIHPVGAEIDIREGANISGKHIREEPKPKPAKEKPEMEVAPTARVLPLLSQAMWWMVSLLAPLAVGLVVIVASPRQVVLVSEKMWESLWMSLGIGFLFFVALPVAALLLCMTLIGLPLGVFVLFFYLVAVYLSKVLVSVFVGRQLFRFTRHDRKRSLFLALLLGLILLTLLFQIPYLGWILWLAVIVLGLGAFLITRKESWVAMREKGII